MQDKLEGNFRYNHVRLRTYVVPINSSPRSQPLCSLCDCGNRPSSGSSRAAHSHTTKSARASENGVLFAHGRLLWGVHSIDEALS